MCRHSLGHLMGPIKALNIFIVFEVRTLPVFYPKEIIRESCRIFMCQDVAYSVICNLKKKKKKGIPNYIMLKY